MATLGNAAFLGPGLKIVGESSAESLADRQRVSVKPAVLFLINYLLKGLDTAEVKNKGKGDGGEGPALFEARDEEGLWKIAYRSDALVLARIPGSQVDGVRIDRMLEKLLPKAGSSKEGLPIVPEGIVFRKICVQSGLRATSICPHVIREPFLRGTQPEEWCPQRHGSNVVGSESKK
jgi:hypothetical protein